MNYDQIMREIEILYETIMYVDDTVKYNISTFWTVLGIGLAAVSIGAFVGIKYLVTDEVEKRLKNEVSNRLSGYSKVPDLNIPTLTMGWRGNNIQYWKDENGYVTLDGVVSGGISGQKMMNFPSGYHPHEELKIPLICSSGSGYCTIGEDGFVVIKAPTEAIVRFGNIRFKANEVK